MKTYVAGQEARSIDDAVELALGTPLELWLGIEGETVEEYAARQDAARDILADEPELFDRVSALVAGLIDTVPIRRTLRSTSRRAGIRQGVAA